MKKKKEKPIQQEKKLGKSKKDLEKEDTIELKPYKIEDEIGK